MFPGMSLSFYILYSSICEEDRGTKVLSTSKAGGDLNKNLDNVYKRIKAIKAVLSFEFYLRKSELVPRAKILIFEAEQVLSVLFAVKNSPEAKGHTDIL